MANYVREMECAGCPFDGKCTDEEYANCSILKEDKQ